MDPTALDYLTLTVAIFGAVTGAVTLGVQVVSFVLSGPRVKATASANLHTGNALWFRGIRAADVGRAPVTVQGITWASGSHGLPNSRTASSPGTTANLIGLDVSD